jgi:hypothetical protein
MENIKARRCEVGDAGLKEIAEAIRYLAGTIGTAVFFWIVVQVVKFFTGRL